MIGTITAVPLLDGATRRALQLRMWLAVLLHEPRYCDTTLPLCSLLRDGVALCLFVAHNTAHRRASKQPSNKCLLLRATVCSRRSTSQASSRWSLTCQQSTT